MKRFTLFIVAALIATLSFAQQPVLTSKTLFTPPTELAFQSELALGNNPALKQKKAPKKVVEDGTNATMVFSYSSGNINADVTITQDPETKEVTISNFATFGVDVKVYLKEDKTFIIPSQLILGNADDDTGYYTYSFTSGGSLGTPEITGTATETVLTFDTYFSVFNPVTYSWYGLMGPAVITLSEGTFEFPVIEEVATTPATPSVADYLHYSTARGGVLVTVDVPDTDQNSNDLKKDLLSYQIYFDNGESTFAATDAIAYTSTVSPVTATSGTTRTITVTSATADPVRVGVKSIYTAAGETKESEIAWFDVPQLVTPPSGLTALEKSFCYAINGESAFIDANLIVNESNNEVYLQGFSTDYPDAWIKGTVDADNNFTFPNAQFLAIYSKNYDIYMYAGGDIVFNYDETTDVWKTDQQLYINASRTRIYYLKAYDAGSTITERKDDPATPANPSIYGWNYDNAYAFFIIPVTDADGNAINGGKLSFQLFSDIEGTIAPIVFTSNLYSEFDEDTSVIPYTIDSDYIFDYSGYKVVFFLQDNFTSFNKVGIQTIYTGGDEEHKSDLVWSNLLKPYAIAIDAKTADGQTYYTTFYGSYSYVADDNTTVYTAKLGADGTWLDLAEVADKVIPAGNAVILEGNAASIQLKGSRAAAETIDNNDLKGAAADTAVEEGTTYYVLSNGDAGVGFYQFAGETLAAGKAYIEVSGDAAAKVLPFGGTTAINGVADVKADDAVIYNLAGQRVNNAQKGIFIQNGKKVVF